MLKSDRIIFDFLGSFLLSPMFKTFFTIRNSFKLTEDQFATMWPWPITRINLKAKPNKLTTKPNDHISSKQNQTPYTQISSRKNQIIPGQNQVNSRQDQTVTVEVIRSTKKLFVYTNYYRCLDSNFCHHCVTRGLKG